MKKLFIYLTGTVLFLQHVHAQKQTWVENFDDSIYFTAIPNGSWRTNTVYHLPSTSQNNPKSYQGLVPNLTGDSTILETPQYDCSIYSHVLLRFHHICKISTKDMVRIEYRIIAVTPGPWQPLPWNTYLGKAANYALSGFNSGSYPEWKSNDNLALPDSSWWKEELFDLWFQASYQTVQFRFVIKHGTDPGTQVAYGWLLENFELVAATHPLRPPTVQLIQPLVNSTAYSTGPWVINAKVKTNTTARIATPLLKYTAINGSQVDTGSVLMTHVQGDSLWKANVPQFVVGTKVYYTVEGWDTLGNTASVSSNYTVTMAVGVNDYVYFGAADSLAGTSVQSLVLIHGSLNSWSRHLYLNSELKDIPYKDPVLIHNIAFRMTGLSPIDRTKIKIYLKATNETTLPQVYVNPVSEGATLVYEGTMKFAYPGWIDIQFDTPFLLPIGSNLIVQIEDHTPTASGSPDPNFSSASWRASGTNTNTSVNGSSHITGTVNSRTAKPVTRFKIEYPDYGTNSVSMVAIDIKDTVEIFPNTPVPIVAVVKNRGMANLNTVTVSYILNTNAVATKIITLNPALTWDFDFSDTLGYYFPKPNGKDTITVWVSNPNGMLDNVTRDDTLRKTVFGGGDIRMKFVQAPDDTTYMVKPSKIIAEINILSTNSTVDSAFLLVTTTLGGVSKNDTLKMQPIGSNQWTTTIEAKPYGSNVEYIIKFTDSRGNEVVLRGNYYNKGIIAQEGYVIAGTGTASGNNAPISYDGGYGSWSFSQQLYSGTELNSNGGGSLITKFGWSYATSSVSKYDRQRCYFRAVDITALSLPNVDPVIAGATLVWQGSIEFTAPGWMDIEMIEPFYLPAGKNLLIYWINDHGTAQSAPVWHYTPVTNSIMFGGNFNPAITRATVGNNRPNARFYLHGRTGEEHSVALLGVQPSKSAPAGTTPVVATIQNKGSENLTYCEIHWTINGQPQTPAIYSRNLYEEYTDTITVGTYIPASIGNKDTIVVWVSMPNNNVDLINHDDTLTVYPLGCTSILSGLVTVGSGKDFATINNVLDAIRNCGVKGDVVLELDGIFPSVNLTDIGKYMDGYRLTITSSGNNPSNAIIYPSSGAGIVLSQSHNVTLKSLTVDVSHYTTPAPAIQFTGPCNNVVIRDCKLLADAATTNNSATNALIYKASNTGVVDNVSIINNLLNGGYYGINFDGGSSTSQLGTNFVFDSNHLSNQYLESIYTQNVYLYCSYNLIESRVVNTPTSWTAIHPRYSRGHIIGNRIIQRSANITNSVGINMDGYYYSNSPNSGLVANNEIMLSGTSTGIINPANSRANVVHNSIYITGNGVAKGIDINNGGSGQLSVQNNNIVLTASSAYPIYVTGQNDLTAVSTMNYNNLYAPDYVGYFANVSIKDMATWRQRTGVDLNSVSILPTFTNAANNLKLANSRGLYCLPTLNPPVEEDIEKQSRTKIWLTTMGCYETIPTVNVNAALTEIKGLRNGEILGETDMIQAVVYNTGSTPLDSINLEWSINGVSRGTSSHSISLDQGQSVVLNIGQIIYPVGNVEIAVWINNLGYLADQYSQDDTLFASISVCPSGGFSGVVTIGKNKDFPTIKQAYNALNMCGVSGDVTFVLDAGIYDERLDLTNSNTLFKNHNFTVTSANNNANSVIIRTSSGWGIRLSNTNNFTLKAITIDAATNGTNAIEFAAACTNIVIKDCKLLANTTTTSNVHNPIYRPASTDIVFNISFINNVLDGGYYGFYFYGGINNSMYGNNIIFDSNTLTNQYAYGAYPYYVNFTSCSNNSIVSRTSNGADTWTGLSINYSNGNITKNSIIQKDAAITKPCGLFVNYHNTQNTTNMALIANNEIILHANNIGNGINVDNTHSKVMHNSVYITGTGAARGINIVNTATSLNNISIKNNNIVLLSNTAYPIYFTDIGNLSRYNIDYNNLSAPTYAGYYGGNKDLTQWKQDISTDQHSVNVSPTFVNPALNLELSAYNSALLSPRLDIKTDIKEVARPPLTTMGAYEKQPDGCDLMLWALLPSKDKVVHQESVQVQVEISNNGKITANSAVFGWSINGTVQQPSVNHTFGTPLTSLERVVVPIGVFATDASISNHFDIVVWLESVNGNSNLDAIKWNDTARTTYVIQPLAEWVAPITKGIITNQLSFDVHAKIQTETGAPITAPHLKLETKINGNTVIDSVAMVLTNGIWTVSVPQQYYNSEVIYSLTVFDALGNDITLKDTVYPQIDYTQLQPNNVIIGTGTSVSTTLPIAFTGMTSRNSWSRQLYLYREVCPDLNPDGTIITKIAWESQNIIDYFDNQTCYMRAVNDSVEMVGYLNPVLATQVWGSARLTVTGTGWAEITLNTPFYLPPGKNLQIIWEDRSNKTLTSPSTGWRYTVTPVNRAISAADMIFPSTVAGTLTVNRPNIKITTESVFEKYIGHNLALVSLIPHVYDTTDLCEGSSYLPVKVVLENMSENDYNFAIDSISIGYKITTPLQTTHSDYITISSGRLKSKTIDTFEVILPVMYAGKYDVKAFVISPLDNYPYDDTNSLSFTSGRIGLPLEEYFAGVNIPSEFVSVAIIGTEKWEVYVPTPTSPQPTPMGTNTLRYAGAKGDMARLITRPLDLFGTVNAKLEFWYYHDASASLLDDSYTDVNIIVDGVPTRLYTAYRRDGRQGWQQHIVPLSSYPANLCVQIQFESMNKSNVPVAQYIDRIIITSEPDLAVDEILVSPEITICDMKNKDISVVIRTTSNHTIDFSQYPTSLTIEISGYQPTIYPLQGLILGHTSDTIAIPSKFNFKTGINTVKVYLTSPVDNISANDTAAPFIIDINPALAVTVLPITSENANCVKKGSQMQQSITVKNTGDMDISEISLILNVDDAVSSHQTIRKTVQVNLPPSADTTITFDPYIVPSEEHYFVAATVYLTCDSALANHKSEIRECTDMEDLVLKLIRPEPNTTDAIGTSNEIQVLVKNAGFSSYQNIIVTARIENTNGNLIDSIEFKEVISNIEFQDSAFHTFSKKYTVPNEFAYFIKVFINSQDNYPENDTVRVERHTSVGIIANNADEFVLQQNIPNPAKNNTMIEYSIPTSGEIIFNVYTITGQLLYAKTIQSKSGKHSIELNTSNFAAGIYFYSMEYKGQKLVKRMSVRK